MNMFAKAALFGLLSATFSGAQAVEHQHSAMMNSAQEPAIGASGEVKAIDMENHKITIAHDAITAVNWPAMTMRFTITPQTHLGDIHVGDKVAFTFIQHNSLSLLQDIHLNK